MDRKLKTYIMGALMIIAASCSGTAFSGGYDAASCEALATKIERRDSLTQRDYSAMIHQSEEIMKYLISKSSRIEELPADERYSSYRELLAEPEYMERFSFLFSLGSALYQANASGRLDADNAAAYEELDEYNTRFADITDRL